MAGTVVVALRSGDDQLAAVAGSVRALVAAGTPVVVDAPSSDMAGSLTLALGQSRSGRRAVPVMTHTLVDPADPAFAHPPMTMSPEPLAVLEAEAIGALLKTGFAVVTAGHVPVVPFRDDYRRVAAALDEAASAQRLAGDLGASVLVFVAGDDRFPPAGGPPVGDIDLMEVERRLTGDPLCAPELRAAARFIRAGGELAAITTPAQLAVALDGPGDGLHTVRIHRRVARPKSEAPALAAGWC